MLNEWSWFEQAWRDTLIHKAEGSAFDTLARMYGVPRPAQEASEYAWRGALHAEALGRRGTLATTMWAIEAALSDYNETFLAAATVDPRVTEIQPWNDGAGGGKLSGLDSSLVNRLWRSKYGLLWSEVLTTDTVTFSPYTTTYWDACPVIADGETFEVQLLPFILRERTPGEIDHTGETSPGLGAVVEVLLYTYTAARTAATYMRSAPTKRRITAVNTGTDTITTNAAHGLSVNAPVMVWGSYGAGLSTTDNDGNTHAGTDAPPGGLTDGGKYYVKTAPTTTTLTLSATVGGATVNLTSAQTGTVYIAGYSGFINNGLDPSGHMLESTLVSANVDGANPNSSPAYLFDGTMFPRVQQAIDGCLAAGVRLVVAWDPLLDSPAAGTPNLHLVDPTPGLP